MIWTVPLLCAACGASAPAAPAAPVASVVLTAGTEFGAVAIRNVSRVAFSTPWVVQDATYSIDFGDGQSDQMLPDLHSTRLVFASHRYDSNGVFTARLTVVDAAARGALASGSASITVRDMAGRWTSIVPDAATKTSTMRTFELSQTGSSLSGRYVDQNGVSRAVAGSMSDPRSITLTLDGQLLCQGTDLDRTGIANDLNAFSVLFWPLGPILQPVTFTRQ
jgi:hypothetical protein